MRAALNRPGSDCRPLRMPATRIGRVLATPETARPEGRASANPRVSRSSSAGSWPPDVGYRVGYAQPLIAKCYAVSNLRTS